ncbi:hypothetical protein IAI18_07620 [Acetobacteraceae bacterium H6797]|nr:hypothetical protein [Acetobacteraceae bacterium H6797]
MEQYSLAFDLNAVSEDDPLRRLAALGFVWPVDPFLCRPEFYEPSVRLGSDEVLPDTELTDMLRRARHACLQTPGSRADAWPDGAGRDLLAVPAFWGVQAAHDLAGTALRHLALLFNSGTYRPTGCENALAAFALGDLRSAIASHRTPLLKARGLGRVTRDADQAANAIVTVLMPAWPSLAVEIVPRGWGQP